MSPKIVLLCAIGVLMTNVVLAVLNDVKGSSNTKCGKPHISSGFTIRWDADEELYNSAVNMTLQQAKTFGTGFEASDLFCCPLKDKPDNCRLAIFREATTLEKSRVKLQGLEQKVLSTKVVIMKAENAVYTRWNHHPNIRNTIVEIQKAAEAKPCNVSSMVEMYDTIFTDMIEILHEAQEKLRMDLDKIEKYYSSESFDKMLQNEDHGKETFTDFTSVDKWCARHFEKDYWSKFLKTFV